MIRKELLTDEFEAECRNYVYRISKREIEKVALGLNLKKIAFKGFNTAYVEGCDYEKASKESKLLIK